jgi:hypothetical protein
VDQAQAGRAAGPAGRSARRGEISTGLDIDAARVEVAVGAGVRSCNATPSAQAERAKVRSCNATHRHAFEGREVEAFLRQQSVKVLSELGFRRPSGICRSVAMQDLTPAQTPAHPGSDDGELAHGFYKDVSWGRRSDLLGLLESFMVSSVLTANLTQLACARTRTSAASPPGRPTSPVPTMIPGIYGMTSSRWPELTWTFGYPRVLAVSRFRKTGWL